MFGTSTLGSTVLGGVAGGAIVQSVGLDLIVVERLTKTTAFDLIVIATTTQTTAFDMIIAASGIKFFGLDFIVVEKEKDNLPYYEAIGNNLSLPIEPVRSAVWSTATRPSSPLLYQEGINTQTNKKEWWDGTNWRDSQGNIL